MSNRTNPDADVYTKAVRATLEGPLSQGNHLLWAENLGQRLLIVSSLEHRYLFVNGHQTVEAGRAGQRSGWAFRWLIARLQEEWWA